MVVIKILSEELGIGALADSGSSKEEEKLLFAVREVSQDSVGDSEHDIYNKILSNKTNEIKVIVLHH